MTSSEPEHTGHTMSALSDSQRTDATASAEAHDEDRITACVANIWERRAAIEQAKGMLAMAYGLDDAASFEVLAFISQQSNKKLRDVAAQLLLQFRARSGPVVQRQDYDDILIELLT